MNPRVIQFAFVAFAVAALLGAGSALAAPVPFMRGLGLAAMTGAIAGCFLQVFALRTFAPNAYAALRTRWAVSTTGARDTGPWAQAT
jgi:hypothetical protein